MLKLKVDSSLFLFPIFSSYSFPLPFSRRRRRRRQRRMSTPTGASASTTSASANASASATTGRVTRSRSPPASRPHSAPAPVTPCTVQTDLDWANATTASTAALFTLPVPSGSGSALEPLRDVEAMSRRLLLDRCYADGRGIGGAVHAGCKSSLAWQVLPCRSTGGGVVDGDDEQEYACDRLELRLLSSSDTSTVATSVATASAECCTLCFTADILPQPRVTVVSNGGGDGNDASAAFSISVALTNGLVYLIDVDAAALHRRTFFIRVWRVAKVLAATLGGGSSGTSSGASSVSAMSNTLSLPVLAHFASDALLLVGMSNGTLVCAELQSTQGSAQHYGEMAHHAGSLQLGYAHETVMVPEHGLLSKIIKGFIPWSTTSSSTAGVNISVSGKSSSLSLAKGATSTTSLSAHGTTAAALAARLADEDTRRYGVDLAASQPLAAEAFHVGGESYFVTWSRDQTLRVWRAGHAKCVRAESLCVGAHGSVAMDVASGMWLAYACG